MITTRAVPALLPGHHRPAAQPPVTVTNDLADPLSSGGLRERDLRHPDKGRDLPLHRAGHVAGVGRNWVTEPSGTQQLTITIGTGKSDRLLVGLPATTGTQKH
jgi:hypothetical protein